MYIHHTSIPPTHEKRGNARNARTLVAGDGAVHGVDVLKFVGHRDGVPVHGRAGRGGEALDLWVGVFKNWRGLGLSGIYLCVYMYICMNYIYSIRTMAANMASAPAFSTPS